MFDSILISPSILSCDFTNLATEIGAIENAGTDWVHVDVMDGHFVPNLTIGVPVTAQLRATTKLPLDVHLMISNPIEQLEWFCGLGADFITVHWEAFGSDEEALKACEIIKQSGSKAGIALKPDTPISVLQSTVSQWDMVLVMSVFPGFSGQSFIDETPDRIEELVDLCNQAGAHPLVQVDGGINPQTAALVSAAGADVLVAGNAVFKAEDYASAIADIRSSAQAAQKGRI